MSIVTEPWPVQAGAQHGPTQTEGVPPLVAGDCLTQAEFIRRYEAMPHLKKAELIGGVVYMPSPVSIEHGEADSPIAGWLFLYVAHTPGCKSGINATWLMLADAPQPDSHLRILPEYGGQSDVTGKYASGAPELVVEVSHSSTSYDLHQKRDLYLAAGVQEYLVVLLEQREVRWLRRVAGTFEPLPADGQGIIRSVAFPGLWLNAPALLRGDVAEMLTTLNQGLQSPEHGEFVSHLERRRGA